MTCLTLLSEINTTKEFLYEETPANQSLKPTEPAVGEFAARSGANLKYQTVTSARRATNDKQFAAIGLAPVR